MEIEYTLTMKDLEALTRTWHETRPKRSPVPWQVIWLFLLLVATWILLHLEYAATEVLPYAGYFLAGIFVSAGGWLFFWLWFRKGQSQKNTQADERFQADERNRWLFEPRRIRLHPEGITITSTFQQLSMAWSGIHRIDALAEYVVFWTITTSGHVVPRRAFRDAQHFEEFVSLARQYQEGRGQPTVRPTGIITSLPHEAAAITRPNTP